MIQRRAFITGLLASVVIPTPARLPPFVLRTTIAAGEVYGRSPAMIYGLPSSDELNRLRLEFIRQWNETAQIIMPISSQPRHVP